MLSKDFPFMSLQGVATSFAVSFHNLIFFHGPSRFVFKTCFADTTEPERGRAAVPIENRT